MTAVDAFAALVFVGGAVATILTILWYHWGR